GAVLRRRIPGGRPREGKGGAGRRASGAGTETGSGGGARASRGLDSAGGTGRRDGDTPPRGRRDTRRASADGRADRRGRPWKEPSDRRDPAVLVVAPAGQGLRRRG